MLITAADLGDRYAESTTTQMSNSVHGRKKCDLPASSELVIVNQIHVHFRIKQIFDLLDKARHRKLLSSLRCTCKNHRQGGRMLHLHTGR